MESCCDSLFKTLLLLFNLGFALVGLVLIGFGAYVQVAAKDYLNFLSDNYLNTPVFIIILGVVIFVIAFFGCCGAVKESKCMMYTYGFLLFVILIAQVGVVLHLCKCLISDLSSDRSWDRCFRSEG